MQIINRGICYAMLMLFLNLALLFRRASVWVMVPLSIVLLVFYITYNIRPLKSQLPKLRLGILNTGYELTVAGIVCFTLEVVICVLLILGKAGVSLRILIANALVFSIFLLAMVLNGIIRILICSKQAGMILKACLLLFWWVPMLNIVLLGKILVTSRMEYQFAVHKNQRNHSRKQEALCKTKYPILMVHGVFFRDWEQFNYWGRIPEELIRNGATIFYGNQQSAAAVSECAEELGKTIEKIIKENNCQKVNIIAHSKGGLDSRYAVSALEMGKYVASLTTINTPHQGCNYVKKLLDVIPEEAVKTIGKQYNAVFSKLGDDEPNFFSGLQNLTDTECARLNKLMPDVPGVLYQSVGSRMRSSKSAMFPLSLGYSIIKRFGGGDNDGLVSVESMKWGDFLGVVSPTGKHGISHGDMIDLTRKDIPGFDVCEFYVDLVYKLKLQEL